MKIYYEDVHLFSSEAYQELQQYDTGSSVNDGVLDEFEIQMAGGLQELERSLARFCVGIVGKDSSGDESEKVAIALENCIEMESVLGLTPNGKVYPGVIINVPGGDFEMGTACDGRHHRYDYNRTHDSDEHTSDGKTRHVQISAFRMSKTEVTIGQYVHYLMESRGISETEARKLLPKDVYGYNKKGDDFPIVALSFTEMTEFANYYGGTLPSSAQYEYASKGPSHNDLYGTPINKAILASNVATTTAEVYSPNDERCNGFGLCDLAGNVWDIAFDLFVSDVNESTVLDFEDSFTRRLTTPPNSRIEYLGGSFNSVQRYARAADRGYDFAGADDGSDGFRVVWNQVAN